MGSMLLALLGFLATVLSLMGDTWRPNKKWPMKLSNTGWIMLSIALGVVIINSLKEYDDYLNNQYAKGIVYNHLYPPSLELLQSSLSSDVSVDASCSNLLKAYADVKDLLRHDEILLSVRLATLSCLDASADHPEIEIGVPIFHAINEMCKDFTDLDCQKFRKMADA